ncbi:MAG: 3'-5' exonuclease [Lentisphaerae bacterium]|nr:3'-5' exonuclease [Lentisphaerota bacterium]MCP4103518.1 3'-5' exonuclease [Lentisphaerota bacterium]
MAEVNNWYELGPFTVFDVETTGMSPVRDRIVELAAVRVDQDGKITRFESLVNPNCRIPPQVSRVHRITDNMVVDSPKFSDVGYKFLDLAKESTLVAHNARFDLGFLQESLSRSGLPLWKGKTMDSIRLMKQAYAGLPSYSLQSLRRTFQLEDLREGLQAHRAGADVEWTVQLLQIAFTELLKKVGS